MKTWDQLLPDVLPWAPSASQPLALRAIMRSAQEFMRRTRCLVLELDPVTITTDTTYEIPLPSRTELVRLEWAKVNGQPYDVWTDGDKPGNEGRFLYTRDGINFAFSRALPELGSKVLLTCALQPATTATGIDDVVFRKYGEAIAVGAVYRLTNDANKKLTFDEHVADTKSVLWHGHAAVTKRSRAHFF